MQISELKVGQGSVNVEVKVKSKGDVRTFDKYGKELRVANAIVFDFSGEITMSLWNEDIDKVKVGDVLRITNGYVSEFNGAKQVTSGKFGKIEVVSSGGESAESGSAEESSEKEKKSPKKQKAEQLEEVEF